MERNAMGRLHENTTLSRLQMCDLWGRFRLAVEMDAETTKMFEMNNIW